MTLCLNYCTVLYDTLYLVDQCKLGGPNTTIFTWEPYDFCTAFATKRNDLRLVV